MFFFFFLLWFDQDTCSGKEFFLCPSGSKDLKYLLPFQVLYFQICFQAKVIGENGVEGTEVLTPDFSVIPVGHWLKKLKLRFLHQVYICLPLAVLKAVCYSYWNKDIV